MADKKKYDVALSFAGEERHYVTKVAASLQRLGVSVFYDEYEEVELWGKDLYSHLDYVYREAARYCVVFLSQHYANKVWTNHERVSAQARALEEHSEYVLPARFDDTAVDGLRPTIGYISLRDRDPGQFAELIAQKVGRAGPKPNIPDTLEGYLAEVADYLIEELRTEQLLLSEDHPMIEPGPYGNLVCGTVGDKQYWIDLAYYFYHQFRKMVEAERLAVGVILGFGCQGEMPDLIHMDPVRLTRTAGLSEETVLKALSDVRYLGFTAKRRPFAHEPEPGQIVSDDVYDITLSWWCGALPNSDDATVAARCLLRAATATCCDAHAVEKIAACDFSSAA